MCIRDRLAVDIGRIDRVGIGDGHAPHACPDDHLGGIGAHAAQSYDQHVGRTQFFEFFRSQQELRSCLLYTSGKGEHSSDMALAMQKSYDEGVTDEFVKPVVRIDEDGNPIGMIRPNDVVIFFNYRNDRAKELTIVLTQEDMPQQGMHTLPLYYCCMTPYDAKFEGLHILFDKENVADTIGEYVARQGLSQLRIAETEKYAHVTFFLNGGREEEFEGEDRILVASPKVATYDLQPEMSAYEVADKLVGALDRQKYDFICLNFANGDMAVSYTHLDVYKRQAICGGWDR